MEEVALDEEGAETRGCRSHWVGAARGQSHGEIARFAHGANYIGHQFRGIGVRHRFVSRAVGANFCNIRRSESPDSGLGGNNWANDTIEVFGPGGLPRSTPTSDAQ
jgi:hypothetical protein